MASRASRPPKGASRVTDSFETDGYRFEIVDMDGRRIDKLLVTPPKPAES